MNVVSFVCRIQSLTNVFMLSFISVPVFILSDRTKNILLAVATVLNTVKRNRCQTVFSYVQTTVMLGTLQ